MKEDITRNTYNNIAEKYSATTVFPIFRKMINASAKQFIELLPSDRRTKLLVLGSGDGRDALLFEPDFKNILLYDFSERMMHIAKSKLLNAEAIIGDFRDIKLDDNSIEAVWASTCLYHIKKKELERLFNSLQRIIKPNGVMYFNLKIGKGEGYVEAPPSFPFGGSRYYAFYERQEIEQLTKGYQLLYFKDEHPEFDTEYVEAIIKKI